MEQKTQFKLSRQEAARERYREQYKTAIVRRGILQSQFKQNIRKN
jgi:hypothetical protein